MTELDQTRWEICKVEYDKAISQYLHYSGLRRQDMAFATTVQAAAFTIIGIKLLALDPARFLISIIAFFVLLMGLNSERRLAGYIAGNLKRAKQIEKEYGMTLLATAESKLTGRRLLFSNSSVFPLYYLSFILAWVTIWILNVLYRAGLLPA